MGSVEVKLATGVDLIEIERLREAIMRHGRRFLERIYTSEELEEVGDKPASLAARFAAKEAVAKALGTGIGPVAWREIEVRRGPAGQPVLHLHGTAARLAAQQGLTTWSISLSHSHTHAIALVVAAGG
jgi:holo-[acyl-carrier protein] synthase